MTPRRLAAVGVLAVLAIGGAFWLAGQRSLERDVSSEPLYPGLKEDIDQLEGLRVYGPGDTVVVTVTRVDDRWQVLERGGYPADASRLRNLFRDLAAANRIEQKTAQPERYAELGVEGIEGSDAGGVRIVLEGVDPDVDLIVGKQASGRGGSYVRRSGDAASWLIDRTLAVPRSPAEWLDRAVIDIGADRIQSAEIAADGSEYEAAKASRADADFAVTGVPEARQLSSPGAANGLATSLQRLEADDVR
ncbi:MAG TPA: DUF4340 domain-containing protein, partial [Steroidobacteraceae bacterium]|nr:DUF4340 domain-containing protein [Steroidobacteraceae bacterium]